MTTRHPLAAVLGVAGLVVGAVAALGTTTATAATTDLVATLNLDCETVVSTTVPFAWDDATVTLSAYRPAASTAVTITAQVSDMPGTSPVKLNGNKGDAEMVLELDGTSTTLAGTDSLTNSAEYQPVPVPAMQGPATSSAATLATELTRLKLTVSGIVTTCVPRSSGSLGALTIVEGVAPTITPSTTATTTTSATATPSTSATPTKGSAKGKPATGAVAFACTLLASEFEYDAKISVSGYREDEGDDVSLVATMSDLPGKSPVVIDGSMDYTLDLKVGGEKVTLTSTGPVSAQPYKEVPVADLSGSVPADEDELAVVVTGFTFNFAAAGVSADCTASSVALSKLTVGSEAVDTKTADATPSDSTTTGSTTTGGTTLPKTGGGDSMPVVALWALALTLLGVAGLLCVPRTRRQH